MTENRKYSASIRKTAMVRVKHEIDKLNRRAKKLGLAELVIEITGEKQREIFRTSTVDGTSVPTGIYETWLNISIIGEAPKLAGWEFLGTLDHAAGDTIVRNVPGSEIPMEYWSDERVGLCEHCNTKRRRKETFIVKHVETGECKQVGRQCVADFLGGKSVESVIWLGTFVRKVGEILDDDYEDCEFSGCLWRDPVTFDAKVGLATAVRVVNEYGYLSRKMANINGTMNTADRISNIFWPPPTHHLSKTERDGVLDEIERCTPTEEDYKKAEEIRKWVTGAKAISSYVFNLQAIVKRETVQYKEIGFLASLVPFYFRDVENSDYDTSGVQSGHIGEPKKRMEIDVECMGIGSTQGDYGEILIYRLKSGDDKITWFSSSNSRDIEIGGKYKVKATVKKHDVYRGENVTHVTRVKVIEDLQSVA